MEAFRWSDSYNIVRERVISRIHEILSALCGDEGVILHAIDLEKSCFNHVIKHCKDINSPLLWSSKYFTQYYAMRTHKVINLIDLDYATGAINAKKILRGEIAAFTFADMSDEEVDPFNAERNKVIEKIPDVIENAVCTKYKCPNCKAHNCHLLEVQVRSLDEGKSLFAICNDCEHRWSLSG